MQPTWTVWTLLEENHTGIIPVKFGQNPPSGLREEVVQKNCWRTDGRTMEDGQWAITKAHSVFVLPPH